MGDCHRDYSAAGDIQIKIMDDVLRVASPGQLPFDMTMAVLLDVEHSSHPRNKLLAQIFYDMGLVEHYGSGIRRIIDACRESGNAIPEWKDENGEFVTRYTARVHSNAPSNAPDIGALGRPRENGVEGQIYALIRESPGVNRKTLCAKTGIPERTMDRSIAILEHKGGIIRRGGKRSGGYYPL